MVDDLDFLEYFGPALLDSFFVVDKERRVQRLNQAFVDLVGLRPAQRRSAVGRPCFELLKLDICQKDCIAISCLARDGPVRLEEVHGTSPDGRELVLTLSAIPMRNADGTIAGIFVTHRDVTDERHLMIRYAEERRENKTRISALLGLLQEREAELARLRKK